MSNGVRRLRAEREWGATLSGRVDTSPGRHKVSKKTKERLAETNSQLDRMYDRLTQEMEARGRRKK